MYISRKLSNGPQISIIVTRKAKERLRTKCFRGRDVAEAGNFVLWEDAGQALSDHIVLQQFLDAVSETWHKREFGTQSATIEYTSTVGWSSTDLKALYGEEELEWFCPNRHSRGLRIKSNRQEILAPLTNLMTVVFEFKWEHGHPPVAIIHSFYPGPDIGPLNGDISEREQIVFFGWNHPGEKRS